VTAGTAKTRENLMLVLGAEQAMYAQRNIVARWRNICTSLAIATAWYHFTWRRHFI